MQTKIEEFKRQAVIFISAKSDSGITPRAFETDYKTKIKLSLLMSLIVQRVKAIANKVVVAIAESRTVLIVSSILGKAVSNSLAPLLPNSPYQNI